ncbi:hypothetical protein HDA32_001381 [Spinactinospora alkalitolerans]|uniref:Uncharacterized protein n=1 Tax=Spinactinospora alkalitolerans TaxID=687207 RepID=A0A852TRR9_9ACTN|nr:hypothetical protein [Spinactinospora alkalitolerans]NYE46261.1 hypothetical protein [Spinactinospora alkalitolerans]
MSHYPDPQQGSGDPYYGQPGGTPHPQDPYAQGGVPSGGYPSGQMVPYDQGAQTGGWQTPGYQQSVPSGGQPVAALGDITVTQTEVITPGGAFPLRGSTWSINDMSHVQEKMATWALVVALIGFFFICVFSLFFLLVKEKTVSGSIQVSVRNGQAFHTTQVGVYGQGQINQVHQQFNYIRSLAAAA